MATYLLTWNPKNWRWEDLDDEVHAVRIGESSRGTWSTGGSRRARPGDRLFLLRHGLAPRGIMGSGWATSGVFQDQHWDDGRARKGDLANYVELEWDALIDPTKESLFQPYTEGPLARVHWRTKASGIQIPDDAAQVLERLWARHVASLGLVLRSKTHLGNGAGNRDGNTDDEEFAAFEGELRLHFVRHRRRERQLRQAKLRQVLKTKGRLACEVPGCGFDFHVAYGTKGAGYAQVHHLRPLAQRGSSEKTRLKDLAVVCANCHAMIHLNGECRPLEGLVAPIRTNRTA